MIRSTQAIIIPAEKDKAMAIVNCGVLRIEFCSVRWGQAGGHPGGGLFVAGRVRGGKAEDRDCAPALRCSETL